MLILDSAHHLQDDYNLENDQDDSDESDHDEMEPTSQSKHFNIKENESFRGNQNPNHLQKEETTKPKLGVNLRNMEK